MLLFSASRFLDLLSSLSLCEDFEEVLVSELALPLKNNRSKVESKFINEGCPHHPQQACTCIDCKPN